MVFNTGAALLDAIVLAVVSKEPEGTYGYKITQDVRGVLDISESTLYPVLRRLQKDDCLEVYDQAYAGRNRRYYKLTEKGQAMSWITAAISRISCFLSVKFSISPIILAYVYTFRKWAISCLFPSEYAIIFAITLFMVCCVSVMFFPPRLHSKSGRNHLEGELPE